MKSVIDNIEMNKMALTVLIKLYWMFYFVIGTTNKMAPIKLYKTKQGAKFGLGAAEWGHNNAYLIGVLRT